MVSLGWLRRDASPAPRAIRLHVGCGRQPLSGWVNIDNQELPGVDQVLDIRAGLPFENVEAIYAEHFLEHLTLDEALAFLRECRRALAPDGVLRLSTPNLDWVYLTHYRQGPTMSEAETVSTCLQLNKAFYGWGHQFLFNRGMLTAALKGAGFATTEFFAYGQSGVPFLRNLERHERSADSIESPHVIIVEASGQAAPVPMPEAQLEEFRAAARAR